MSNLATIVNNILADSGIDDINVVVTTGSYNNPAWITALSWGKISSTPTTLSGYGITDAVPSSRTLTINGTSYDLSANRSWTIAAGVSSIIAGTGISVSGSGNITVTNTGVLSINGSTGAITGIITTSNYNSYSPTLTGGGASGTWGINITGTSGSISGFNNPTTAATANTTVYRDASAYIYAAYYNAPANSASPTTVAPTSMIGRATTSDKFYYDFTAGAVAAFISGQSMNIAGNASTATAAQGATFLTQPNATWGARLQIGGNGGGSAVANIAVVQATDGNLHMDNGVGKSMYLNYYENGIIYLNGSTYYISANGSQYNGNAATATTASTANTVAWTNIGEGNRENYSIGFRPIDNSSSYAGFSFATPGNNSNAGYLLIRGGGDSDVYTQNGITLVADTGWLTLAQRTTAGKGIRFMTGSPSSVSRMEISTVGVVTIGGNIVLNAGNYNSYSPTLTGGGASGTWGINVTGSAGSVSWGGVTGKPSNIMFYEGFTLNADTMSTNSTGFTYAVNAPFVGPIVRFSTNGGYDMWLGGDYSGGGNNFYIRTRNGDAGVINSWRTLVHSGNIGSQSVNFATTAIALNSSNQINQAGSQGSWNADFQNTPNGTTKYGGDVGANGVNGPGGSWWIQQNFRHTNASSFWGVQVAWGWEDNANRLATRNVTGGSYGGWVYYLNSSNFASYAINRGGDVVDNVIYFRTNQGFYLGSSDSAKLQVYNTNNQSAFMSFHRSGQYAVNFGLDGDNVMRIGGWSAAANRWQLDMSGNMTVAGDVTAYSDARVKENIVTVENALEKTLQLRGVYYNRIDSDDKKRKIGVIAQETLNILPEVVCKDNDDMYNVAYGNMGGLFIEAIKELAADNKYLRAQIEELKKSIN